MPVENYQCKCSCGNYETAFDMTLGTAVNAANMHSMLGCTHVVQIRKKDVEKTVVVIVVSRDSEASKGRE